MVTINFREKYGLILKQLKEEALKSKIKLDIEQAKRIIAKTIIYILYVLPEKEGGNKIE